MEGKREDINYFHVITERFSVFTKGKGEDVEEKGEDGNCFPCMPNPGALCFLRALCAFLRDLCDPNPVRAGKNFIVVIQMNGASVFYIVSLKQCKIPLLSQHHCFMVILQPVQSPLYRYNIKSPATNSCRAEIFNKIKLLHCHLHGIRAAAHRRNAGNIHAFGKGLQRAVMRAVTGVCRP